MFKFLASLALVSAVVAAPAAAQTREAEYGADVVIKWMKPSVGDGLLRIQTPVDFRVAFHNGATAIEARISALYLSGSGDNVFTLDPGVNVLFGLPGGTRTNGTYATIGGDVQIVGGSGATGASAFSFNGGFGIRRPMGKAATRLEIFVGYTPSQTHAGQTTTIGARLGISFFN